MDSSSTQKEGRSTPQKRLNFTPAQSRIPTRVQQPTSVRAACTSSLPEVADERRRTPTRLSTVKASSCSTLDDIKEAAKSPVPSRRTPVRLVGASRRTKDTASPAVPQARCFGPRTAVCKPRSVPTMESLRTSSGLRRAMDTVALGTPVASGSPVSDGAGQMRWEATSSYDWTFCRRYRDLSVGDWNAERAYRRVTEFNRRLRDSCGQCELGRNILALVFPTDHPHPEVLGRVCVAIASFEKMHAGHQPDQPATSGDGSHSERT